MIRIKPILTDETQSTPLLRGDFLQALEKKGFLFIESNPDLLLVHASLINESHFKTNLPIVVLERIDSSVILKRDLIDHPQVVGVIKNTILRNRKLNNVDYSWGRYHAYLIGSTINPPVLPDPKHTRIKIEDRHFEKLEVGYGFYLYDHLYSLRSWNINFDKKRAIDVAFGGTTKYGDGNNLMTKHRQTCVSTLRRFQSLKTEISSSRSVPAVKYHQGLLDTKICVSPWGLGEACYRDYESFFLGCVMVKPDSHFVESWPETYVNGVTYVPCATDFSDLEEVCTEITRNWDSYREMRVSNRKLMEHAVKNEVFAEHMAAIFRRCAARANLLDED